MQSAPHGQPGSQQQPMGLPPNNVPPMGMLSGPPNPGHPMNQQRYQMQMQQQQQQQQQPSVQQRQMMMRPPGQPMNPTAGGSHMVRRALAFSIFSTNTFLQGPGFAPNHMMHQQGRRGVSSTSINPGAPPHLAGHMQQMGGMNQQPNMMGQMRQQQPPQSIPGPAMRSVSAGHMSPEMGMAMGRPGGNPGMPQNINRTGSAPMPMMNGINQPSMGQPPSMQVGMSSNHQNYQSPVPMSMQHQQPQLSGSPRPPSHPSSQPPNMNIGPGPSNPGMNRVSMPPSNESPMEFMDFSAQPFSAQGSSNGNNQFAFVPSSTPPTQPMSRSLPPNLGNTPPNRGGFQLTPAQQFAEMQQNADSYSNFAMPPPRPPSHNLHTAPLQQSQPSHAHSPHSGDHMNVYPPRPHSRPQSQPGRPLSSQEPRAVQHIPPNPSLGPGPPQGRLQPQHTGPHPHPPQPGLPPPLSSSVNPPQPSNSARPPNQPPNSNFGHGGSPASSSTMSSSDQQASTSVSRSINPA